MTIVKGKFYREIGSGKIWRVKEVCQLRKNAREVSQIGLCDEIVVSEDGGLVEGVKTMAFPIYYLEDFGPVQFEMK